MSASNEIFQIFLYCTLILVPLGLAGNTLMYIIFARKGLKNLSLSIYFRAMAIVNLFITINWAKIFLMYEFDYYITERAIFLCKSINYLIFAAGPISAWIQVATGIDRFLTIIHPNRFKITQKYSFQVAVIAVIFAYNMIFYFHMLFDLELIYDNSSNSSSCWSYDSQAISISDFVNTALLPFSLMFASSVATIYGVIASRRRLRKDTDFRKYSPQDCRVFARDVRFGITIIVLNVIFFVTNAPSPLSNAIAMNNFNSDSNSVHILFATSTFSYYSFYCLIFYLQLAVNSLVRRHFLTLLGLRFNVAKKSST